MVDLDLLFEAPRIDAHPDTQWRTGVRRRSKRKLERKEAPASRHRQAKPRPFDEDEYYERVFGFIPFGTAAWWRQMQDECANQPWGAPCVRARLGATRLVQSHAGRGIGQARAAKAPH
jgi:hypothetical protein